MDINYTSPLIFDIFSFKWKKNQNALVAKSDNLKVITDLSDISNPQTKPLEIYKRPETFFIFNLQTGVMKEFHMDFVISGFYSIIVHYIQKEGGVVCEIEENLLKK